MSYVSTKMTYKQRLTYWLKKGLSYEQAQRRATLKGKLNAPGTLPIEQVAFENSGAPHSKLGHLQSLQDYKKAKADQEQIRLSSVPTSTVSRRKSIVFVNRDETSDGRNFSSDENLSSKQNHDVDFRTDNSANGRKQDEDKTVTIAEEISSHHHENKEVSDKNTPNKKVDPKTKIRRKGERRNLLQDGRKSDEKTKTYQAQRQSLVPQPHFSQQTHRDWREGKTGNFSLPSCQFAQAHNDRDVKHSIAPYWVLSIACSAWLVQSMAVGLGGGFWNYLIAAAFDFSPVVLAGAPVDGQVRKYALGGSILIFLAGLTLYLAPILQTLNNELVAYDQANILHASELDQFKKASLTSRALQEASEAEYKSAEAAYRQSVAEFGNNSWRTGTTKQKKEQAFTKWNALVSASQSLTKPEVPIYSDSLRQAIQEITKRVGLFGIAFLSIVVMRSIQSKKVAQFFPRPSGAPAGVFTGREKKMG